MAIECLEKNWWFSRPEPTFVPKDTRIAVRNTSAPLEVVIRTPNVLERIAVDRGVSYFSFAENIKFSDQSFWGWLIGRGRFYRWRNVPEIDEKYEELETAILQSPLIGRNVLVYSGTVKPGIHEDLLSEGYRVDEKEVRGKNRRIVTTNAETAQGLVLEGLRDNFYERLARLAVPRLKIKMLEGPLESQEVMISHEKVAVLGGNAEDFKILLKVSETHAITCLTGDELRYIENRGYSRDLLTWVATHHSVSPGSVRYKPREGMAQEKIDAIIRAASQAGIDVREPIAISTRGGVITVELLDSDFEIEED